MEGYIYKWLNIISGFKPRYAIIQEGKLHLSGSKEESSKCKTYELGQSKVCEDKKPNHFSIEIGGKKLSFKTYSEYERTQWLKALREQQINFKPMDKNEIEPETDKDLHQLLVDSLYNIQNNVFELNLALNTLHVYLSKKDKKDPQLINVYEQLLSIKQSMRNNVDDTIKNVVDFNSKYCRKSLSKSEIFYEAQENELSDKDRASKSINAEKYLPSPNFHNIFYNNDLSLNTIDKNKNTSSDISNTKDNINQINLHPIEKELEDDNQISSDSSFEDCEELSNTEINFGNIETRKLERQISLKKTDFEIFGDNFSCYFFDFRKTLPSVLKSSNSMVSDMVKNLTKEKASLPVTYNEPLSMLQRQIESFQFYNLLEKLYSEKEIEMKFAYLAGFMTAEISLNIHRLLKPFNPILGETYEFVDVNHKFRSFSEQVSHHPAISAFLLESKNITVYGDSKSKHNFAFFKGALEVNFLNKTHVLVHNNLIEIKEDIKKRIQNKDDKNNKEPSIRHHFTFGKPTYFFKGLLYGTPHYDYVGKVTIDDILNKDNSGTNPVYKCELEFLDEGKKKLGAIEGKIYKNKEVVNVIKGNWLESLSIYSKDGTTLIKEVWRINSEEPYIKNQDTIDNYLISTYANNLNYLPEELKQYLPVSDSRFRPDQRQHELGNNELAEELKKKLEEKQRARAKKLEQAKQVYKPMYFELAGDESGKFYIPIKDYWKDRQEGNLKNIHDIFNLDEE